MDIAYRLKALREIRGLSIGELSELSAISKSTLTAIEEGRKSPSIKTIEKICKCLGIGLADFFGNSPVLPEHIRHLLEEAKHLTPKQCIILAKFLSTIGEEN